MFQKWLSLVLMLCCGAPAVGADLLISGGTVVNATGSVAADVRIRGERIVAIGQLSAEAGEQVVDARNRLILPGGIDPHVHLVGKPGPDTFVDDFASGTGAALAGGITTVGNMAFPEGAELPTQTLARIREDIQRQARADVFLHVTVVDPSEQVIAQLPELVAAGQPSVKVFMPFPQFEAAQDGYMRLLAAARDAGVVVAMHCEDLATVNYVGQVLAARDQTSLAYYAQSRPVLAESVATQRAVAMAETTGAAIYIVHLSAQRALEAADVSSAQVFIETRPLYLHLTEAKYADAQRGLFVGMPPLRSESDRLAMWQGLADGRIDTIATDHAPYTREQKLDPRQTIERFRAGVNNLQVMLPMLFSQGVNGGRLSVERFVAVTSTNPAKIFGLYPRKGIIEVGADADLVLWNPSRTGVIEDKDVLSNAGFSIYAGTEVTGWPETTIRRGEVVFDAGRVLARPGSGQLVRRQPLAGE